MAPTPASPREIKDEAYAHTARLSKALASPKRVELLDLLAQAPRTVEVLAQLAALGLSNTSQHLKALHEARLVVSQKRGQHVEYRLASPEVGALLHRLHAAARAQLAELEVLQRALHGDAGGSPPAAELLRRALAGEVTLLDVRPAEEHAHGHLPGARSAPMGALHAALPLLPVDRDVVVYCRGPWCAFAGEAVTRLRAAGLRAHRLELGPLDWAAAGLPAAGAA
jgi:rhodanese-related sulfurtransferase/DNA-binding transcriptional ArsR family regulator